MKVAFCLFVLVAGACAVEEKKTEKRGVLGLGYGVGAPLSHGYGPGLGLYSNNLYGGHGLYGGLSHGYYGGLGHGAYGGLGHGVYGGLGHGLYGGGLYGGHGLIAPAAPLISHSAPLLGAPLLGLGHGLGHGYLH